jgi:radical SAM superfamily enzyme YgiQ (UPF0313 family)
MALPRITFVQKNPFPNFGILSIAGYLKQHDIASDVLIADLEKDIFKALNETMPDLIGITCMSTEYMWVMDFIKKLRLYVPETPVILGGVHPTVYSEKISPESSLDYICVGEGEELLVELMRHLDNGPPESIAGLCYKSNDKWVRNAVRRRIPSLDWQEDREIYYRRYTDMAGDDLKQFLSGRGCYYNCNFCFNAQINSMYGNDGLVVRRKRPDLFVQEIKDVVSCYGARSLFFADDIFASDKTWLQEFIPIFKSRVTLPFMCTARANMIDSEIVRLLRQGGCHTVSMGVESGDEELRRNILGKHISDGDLIEASRILRDNKIRLQTSNMFVLPGETVEKALKTIELNIQMKTTFAFASFLMPFPGNKIARIAQESGVLKKDYDFKDMPNSFFTKSVLDIPDKQYIDNVHSISYWCIRHPWLYPIFKKLVYIKFPLLFKVIFLGGLFFRYKEERQIGFFSAVKLFWRFRKSA